MKINYPEWFKVEKEAASIIHQLSNFHDLTFYLQNSNPYIRFQALLRLQRLRTPESISLLEEILNNPLETTANRRLAGQTIYHIAQAHNLNLFIANPFGDAEEDKLNQYCEPVIKEPTEFYGLFFSPPPLYAKADLEEDYLMRNNEIELQISLDFASWFQAWKSNLWAKTTSLLKNIPGLLTKGFKKIKFISLNLIKKVLTYFKEYLIRLYYRGKNKINFFELVKSLIFYLLYLILTPFRLIRNNKGIVMGALLIFSLYWGYISRDFDLLSLQNWDWEKSVEDIWATGKDFIQNAWWETGNLSSLWLKKIQDAQIWNNIRDYFFMAMDFIKGI